MIEKTNVGPPRTQYVGRREGPSTWSVHKGIRRVIHVNLWDLWRTFYWDCPPLFFSPIDSRSPELLVRPPLKGPKRKRSTHDLDFGLFSRWVLKVVRVCFILGLFSEIGVLVPSPVFWESTIDEMKSVCCVFLEPGWKWVRSFPTHPPDLKVGVIRHSSTGL